MSLRFNGAVLQKKTHFFQQIEELNRVTNKSGAWTSVNPAFLKTNAMIKGTRVLIVLSSQFKTRVLEGRGTIS